MKDVLTGRARKIAYRVYALVGVFLGSIPVYFSTVGEATPKQVLGALAVYAFVGAPLFGETAAQNVQGKLNIGAIKQEAADNGYDQGYADGVLAAREAGQ